MTPSELKAHVEKTGSVFFSRKTMQFFGDTMRNYGVRAAYADGLHLWELYRKRPVKMGNKDSAFFDKTTFERYIPKRAYND